MIFYLLNDDLFIYFDTICRPKRILFFYWEGGKKCEIRPRFSIPSAFEPSAFGNEARYSKTKINLVTIDDGRMFSPKLIQFSQCSS